MYFVQCLVDSMLQTLIPFYDALRIAIGDRLMVTLLIAVAHTAPVLGFQLFLMIIGHMKYFQQYLTQPHSKVDPELAYACWKHSAISHLIMMPLLIFLVYPPLKDMFVVPSENIPDLLTMSGHVFFFVVVEDFFFYWGHRILHHPFLYKRIHKKHHMFKTLTGYCIASEFTHPVETVLANVVPVLAGPMMVGPHLITYFVWVVLRMLKTCDAHCGYAFPWSPFGLFFPFNPAERHDFHHEKNLGSFGSFFLIWDTICGTDADFLAWKKKEQ